ncbi:MAG: helix-turn-helix transcriptional regulator [Nitrospira sp.]|nr:helix-turn-helix transcriptional regulator [Nitrospira sp.]
MNAWLRDGDEVAQEGTKGSCSKDDLRVLSLVASGKTNKDIAQELNVPPSIVALRLRKIYKRLNISRRAEAARCYAYLERDSPGHADPIH